MKRKMFILAALMMLAVLMTAPAWARTINAGSASETQVTVQVNVAAMVGIHVPTTTVVFDINAANWNGVPGSTINPTSGTPITVEYFCNRDVAWTFRSLATGNFSDGTNSILASRLQHSATAGTGTVAFAYNSLPLVVQTFYTSPAANTQGWKTSTLNYRLTVQGDEVYSGSPYTTTLTYTVESP